MDPIKKFVKDPDATLDYSMRWDAWLPSGDTIVSAAWSVDDGDGALTVDSSSIVSGVPTVWLSGGTVNVTYRVRCRITTTEGRIDDRSYAIFVSHR